MPSITLSELNRSTAKEESVKQKPNHLTTIDATKVAVANSKLYVNMAEGFIGHGLKKSESEFVTDCSDIDDVIVFREDGKMMVQRIQSKSFVGKNIIHVAVWKKRR